MNLGLNTLTLTALFLVSTVCGTSAAQQNPALWHQVAGSVEIGLSSDWRIATQKQVIDFERERKEIYAQAGLKPKVNPRDTVTFQAEKSEGPDSILLGVTVMPGEASQAEVTRLSDQRVQQLGAVFERQFRSALISAGGSNLTFTRPALQRVGEKTAIAYSVSFTTPDGIRRTGVNYHVYMRNATVVMSATGADSIRQSLRDEANAALHSARLVEH
jgi:hypothetical protein